MRLLTALWALGILVGACVVVPAADVTVSVTVDGKLQKYDPPARVRDGQTFVPLRQGAESLGYDVKWLPDKGVAQLCNDKGCILVKKSEGILVDGRLFLPLRKIGEAFGAKVQWDAAASTVRISRTGPQR